MIDLYPARPASATAIVSDLDSYENYADSIKNNLVRCTLGGIGVGLVEKSISVVDEAATFLALSGLAMLSGGLVLIEWIWGPRWRRQRLLR